jgi:hypothetical protein
MATYSRAAASFTAAFSEPVYSAEPADLEAGFVPESLEDEPEPESEEEPEPESDFLDESDEEPSDAAPDFFLP